MKIRTEYILVSIALLLVAAIFLYRSLDSADLMVRAEPQTPLTETTTQPDTQRHSRYAVNINEATEEELMGVRGMTHTIASGILAYRQEKGRFYAYEELLQVPGIGEATLQKLLPYIKLA